MKFKIVSVFLAATLAFAMAPAHADEGDSEGSNKSSKSVSSSSSNTDVHEKKEGQGHIKYEEGTLKGKGLGHGEKNCASCS